MIGAVIALSVALFIATCAWRHTARQIDELRSRQDEFDERIAYIEGRARTRIPPKQLRAVPDPNDESLWEAV